MIQSLKFDFTTGKVTYVDEYGLENSFTDTNLEDKYKNLLEISAIEVLEHSRPDVLAELAKVRYSQNSLVV